ncbi:hypothetical protein RMATCC62417_13176 [Rhizopus microsporus]|nr:hypothetical protein RMATCC62417_13176 [Rhizopus microsporus]
MQLKPLLVSAFCFVAFLLGVEGRMTFWSNRYFNALGESNVEYIDCSVGNEPFQLESIEPLPEYVKPGENVTVIVKGTVTEKIEDGAYAEVVVKLGLVKLLHKTFDICEELKNNRDNVNIQCPIEKGPIEIKATAGLPREIPRAKFVVAARAFTANDDDLACVNLSVDFRPRRPKVRSIWSNN